MFTGLVETTGRVQAFVRTGAVYTLTVEMNHKNFVSELTLGQSVSVSGACLTVTAMHGNTFNVELMPETVERTWFHSGLRPGRLVNLERALRISDRLDGHLVLGHIDGVAALQELTGDGRTRIAVFATGKDLLRGIVSKGSVALDGVSLTVIDVTDKTFSVGLIPTTLESCTLGALRVGGSVNLETDILGKYVERLLLGSSSNSQSSSQNSRGTGITGITMEELLKLGY